MNTFKLIWDLHKWIGIAVGLVLILIAGTGLVLLLKKDYDWIQPPTMRGTKADASQLKSIPEIYAAVFALGIPEFKTEADIDRIDYRPGKRVHKVRSVHDYAEVQVDAVSGAILAGPSYRASDWIEQLHDGSLIADSVHDWLMPIVAIALCLLAITGYVIWLWPKLKRRRKRVAAAAKA